MRIILLLLLIPFFLRAQFLQLDINSVIDWQEKITALSEASDFKIDFNGNLLLTDAFNNTVLQYSPQTGRVKNAGAESTFSPLSNPIQIIVLPLEIWVLDYDNQRLIRYDQWMRVFESVDIREIQDIPQQVSISSFAVDNNHYFYLLDELEGVLYKLDSHKRLVAHFGGNLSLEPDWGAATRMERIGNRLFMTWSSGKGLILFDDQGNTRSTFQPSETVHQVAGNSAGLWLAVLDSSLWIGKEEKIFAKTQKPKEFGAILHCALQPGQNYGWFITETKLVRFSLQIPSMKN